MFDNPRVLFFRHASSHLNNCLVSGVKLLISTEIWPSRPILKRGMYVFIYLKMNENNPLNHLHCIEFTWWFHKKYSVLNQRKNFVLFRALISLMLQNKNIHSGYATTTAAYDKAMFAYSPWKPYWDVFSCNHTVLLPVCEHSLCVINISRSSLLSLRKASIFLR